MPVIPTVAVQTEASARGYSKMDGVRSGQKGGNGRKEAKLADGFDGTLALSLGAGKR
jgi:hypothetical protein